MKSLLPDISVIIPVLNEESILPALFKRIVPILSKYNYELIFVNDGSTDNTEGVIEKEIENNKSVKIISFTRNFGHMPALTAGYDFAKGKCAITLDADLQDPPELIDEMVALWRKGNKIVVAQRISRQEGVLKKTSANLFYKLLNTLSDIEIPENIADYRLIDKKVLEHIKNLPEKSRYLRGLVAWCGYPTARVSFKREEVYGRKTRYTIAKMFNLALEGITAFSTKPLRFASYLGFVSFFIGLISIAYALFRRFFLAPEYWITGWTALFTAIAFFGGIQLLTVGIIGEYIAKIYKEVQGRPLYIVKNSINI